GERRRGLPVTGRGKTLHRTDQLVLPAGRGVLGIDAIQELVDVRREVVLSPIGLVAHLVQALVLGHHCLRGSSGLAVADRIVVAGGSWPTPRARLSARCGRGNPPRRRRARRGRSRRPPWPSSRPRRRTPRRSRAC